MMQLVNSAKGIFGFRVLGCKGFGFKGFGFKGLGFEGLGFLGFEGAVVKSACTRNK